MDIIVNTYTYKHSMRSDVNRTGNQSEDKELHGDGKSELF